MFQRSFRSFRYIRWQSFIQPWQNIDWTLLGLTVGLTLFGGWIIRSTELNQVGIRSEWWQHWLTGLVGVVICMAIARCRYEALLQWRWHIYGATCASLLAVMFVGTTALGAQRWIAIGGFYIQPSEFAKLGAIITLAALLHERTASTIPALLRALGVVAVPWLMVFVQPDLGTSLVFGAVSLGMLYWANANVGWLVLLSSPLISAILFNLAFIQWPPHLAWAGPLIWAVVALWIGLMGWVGWQSLPWNWRGAIGALVVNLVSGELGHFAWANILKPYQRDRVTLFLNPDQDPLGGGYHLIQSRIAIGAGQLFGRGLHKGTQTQLHFIPEQHTDFIFSAIGEELGFVGCFLVLLAFWWVCFRLIVIAQNARDNFGSLLAIGVFSMLIFQIVVNVGMTIGLAPVTGIPLPWISYGRSAMLMNFISIGLVESVANFRRSRIV